MKGVGAAVLTAWREAERAAAASPEGPEREAAMILVERLRVLYADVTEVVLRSGPSGIAGPIELPGPAESPSG